MAGVCATSDDTSCLTPAERTGETKAPAAHVRGSSRMVAMPAVGSSLRLAIKRSLECAVVPSSDANLIRLPEPATHIVADYLTDSDLAHLQLSHVNGKSEVQKLVLSQV